MQNTSTIIAYPCDLALEYRNSWSEGSDFCISHRWAITRSSRFADFILIHGRHSLGIAVLTLPLNRLRTSDRKEMRHIAIRLNLHYTDAIFRHWTSIAIHSEIQTPPFQPLTNWRFPAGAIQRSKINAENWGFLVIWVVKLTNTFYSSDDTRSGHW